MLEIEGLRLRLFPDDVSMTPTVLMGLYEPQTLASFRHSLARIVEKAKATRQPAVVLDCGANVGLYTLLAAKALQGCGRVLAFEPSPANRTLLEENLIANGLENVEVLPLAVAAGEGKAFLQTESPNAGTHYLTKQEGTASQGIRVSTVRLDHFCQERELRPSLIKMDIEGAELTALPPALSFLLAMKTVLYLELHTHHGEAEGEVRALLDQLLGQFAKVMLLDDTANRKVLLTKSNEPAALALCRLGGNLWLEP